ncbi:ParB N-terminal domain-containing protein [Tsukamurella sp. 8F]|uniref:ParB/RepB/Spo0J family partition protein n=1 Tax=unclassified Tsukamurella TaxID=2633480 RepID=UPI0023B910B0|nr:MULTISPECIES: ParB N-terminal domain-containing protein [unclassified Tsukamurella]MDF0532258.1 ParB N-terminal domain-containing protein [Tsukamurella sp. 8J]MDF0589284.1 ParB N-terminal domain-containing protein [Tsukamurella sp. 8F]
MTATLNTHDADLAVGATYQLPVEDLALEDNIRLDTKLDDPDTVAFVESVADCGVLTPLLGVRDLTGQVVIRDGQRRYLAARRAGLKTVPVYILADDSEGDDRAARRIEQQLLTTNRADLTEAEVVQAVDQLSMFGVPADKIVQRTGVHRSRVDAVLATRGNEQAREHVEAAQLTIEQAATLARFDGDEAAQRRLLAAAERGDFAHEAARIDQAIQQAAARAAAVKPYEEQGIHVLPRRPFSSYASGVVDHWDRDTHDQIKLYPLQNYLTPGGDTVSVSDISPANLWVHIEPGDTADDSWTVEQAFTCDPKADKLRKRPKAKPDTKIDEKAAAAARHERKRKIALNKAALAAEGPRRDFLAALATKKAPPKGAARFLANTIVRDATGMGHHATTALAAKLLGSKDTWSLRGAITKSTTDQRAQVIALVIALSAYERTYHKGAWDHGDRSGFTEYFTYLESIGYQLAEVETVITGKRTPDQAYKLIADADSKE